MSIPCSLYHTTVAVAVGCEELCYASMILPSVNKGDVILTEKYGRESSL